METTVAVLLIVAVCVVVAVALLLSDDEKDEVTIQIDRELAKRLLAGLETNPTKQDLEALKSKLGIEKGSLQLKSGAVYHVTYDADVRKHRWKRLGSYEELADQALSNG